MNTLFNEEESREIRKLESKLNNAKTEKEARKVFQDYLEIFHASRDRFLKRFFNSEDLNPRINDLLTTKEKEMIRAYENSMHKAWTKKGVDRYYNKIMDILDQAQKR